MTGQAAGQAFETKAKHAILIDVGANAVLFEKNADEPFPPASMSKLMTLAIVFRELSEGRQQLETEFEISVNAWRNGGAPSGTSAMMIPVNTTEPLQQLIMGMIVPSGNDAAIAVAEGLAGSELAFASMMAAEAKRIGLTGSTFRNATGLYDPEHLMTARDLAILARFLIKTYPKYYPWFSERVFKYRRHTFRNRNPLLGSDLGVDGLKTGHISKSGYGLVASAAQNGRRLIMVVGGLDDARERKAEAERLLKYGFDGFRNFELDPGGDTVGYARVIGGENFYVPLKGNGKLTVVLPRFPSSQKIRGQIIYDGPLTPPVQIGDRVGTLRVAAESGSTTEIPLYAAADVKPAGVLRRGLDSLAHLAVSWLP